MKVFYKRSLRMFFFLFRKNQGQKSEISIELKTDLLKIITPEMWLWNCKFTKVFSSYYNGYHGVLFGYRTFFQGAWA